MDKLKTLKDIEFDQDECAVLEFHDSMEEPYTAVLDEDEIKHTIKQEAIKWVKNEKGYKNRYRDARADILMEFHNIIEEDLK